ncbi:MAG: TolC family protein [Thermodesulfovibrionales bacterium]|nr:TolC family protein [Thermodesulfovibrionales bacterium]
MIVVIVILFLAFIYVPLAGNAKQPEPQSSYSFTLHQCIDYALRFSPEISEAFFEVDKYKAKMLQADSANYPQIEIVGITSLSPEAKEEDFLRTDVPLKINGVFGSLDLNLIQPLYTYGKISGYRKAAVEGVKVATAETTKKRLEVVLRTTELYYNLLFAKELRNLILEIREQLSKSLEKTQRQLEIGSPWADEINLYKFKAFLGEADKNLYEIEKNLSFLKQALMTSMGIPTREDFDIIDNILTPEEKLPDSIQFYLSNALQMRPEIVQLDGGIKAYQSLIEAEKSNFYPQFFLGLKASLAGATNRDKIKNPYISDHFNRSYAAVFLGLKWSIDFGLTKGKVKEVESEYAKLKEKKRFAEEAIPLEVKKAYLDFEEAQKSINTLQEAFTNAKKWLVSAVANYDLGVGEAKDVADAASLYALTKTNYLKSLLNQRLAYAKLLYSAGIDATKK